MHLYSHREPRPAKTCAVVRYGALGDAMQMTSLFPWLKAQGYHITVYCVPGAYEVIRTDPHVDRFVVQEVDMIPNERLGEFWGAIEKKYDKFVNLSESVERTLLAMPGNMNFLWSHEMRNKHLNKNYVEFVHDIASVPMPSRIKFYQTAEEKAWAKSERERIGGTVILWVLAGSGVHKVWPYVDATIDAILRQRADARFVLVGDNDCKTLEMGWENTPQVHLRSGKWTFRQTLAFGQVADLVIGPETGVMNALSLDQVSKVVLLSHSSVENLTRDWVNCTSLVPHGTSCYPCHKLHQIADGFKHCRESHIKGIAACQADIPPQDMIRAINKALENKNGEVNREEEKLAA